LLDMGDAPAAPPVYVHGSRQTGDRVLGRLRARDHPRLHARHL